MCAPIINEMSSNWDRVVAICDQCVDESDEIEYYIKKSHVNPHDKKGEHEHVFHLFMNLLYYASQGVAEDLCGLVSNVDEITLKVESAIEPKEEYLIQIKCFPDRDKPIIDWENAFLIKVEKQTNIKTFEP